MRFPVTVTLSGSAHDLYVDAAADASVEELCQALCRYFTVAGPLSLSTVDGPADPSRSLAAAGVRAGAVLRVGLAAGDRPAPDRTVTDPGAPDAPASGGHARRPRQWLRVVAGPDAGLNVPLPETGTLTVGRSSDNEIRLSGAAVSRRHAALRCDPGGIEVSDVGSANGVTIDGVRVTGSVRVRAGAVIQIGDDRLVLHEAGGATQAGGSPAEAAVLTALPDGTLRMTRPHRFVQRGTPASVDLPAPPAEGRPGTAAVGISAAGGLLLGVVAYLLWHNLTFLLFSGISTVTLVGTGLVTWVRGRRDRRRARQRHAGADQRQRERIGALLAEERLRLADRAPDAVSVLLTAQQPAARLWERRPTHDDFLELRVGVADQPSGVLVRRPEDGAEVPAETLTDAPVTVELGAAGTIGLAGGRAQTRALARWLVVQAVVQSGPADLSLVVLTRPGDRGARVAWDWVRWLPHARPDTGPLARLGSDETSLASRVEALVAVVSARRQALSGSGAADDAGRRRWSHNWLVVVDDLPEYDVKGLAEVLTHGPEVGVFAIAVEQLPYRCPVTVTFTDGARLQLRRAGRPDLPDVLADQVSELVGDQVGRALAPLRDPELRNAGVGLPAEVPLLDLVPEAADADALAAQWRRRPRQTRVVLGRAGEAPLYVDLVANGPHVLIAGATGWGKSALLQSLVGSLAAANRPDELGFILIDFKGGAAFAALAGLPHTVDLITNLDGQQVMRALDSLAGEMDRRQRYLAAAGVEKLEQYQRRADAATLPAGCPPRLPRLLVVIDEFAILKERLPPDILARLVHVATVGRSLGLHLVIGTQTPRGVVPAEIRPNINLQVALHLPAEHSVDVVGVPDASDLTVKGRGYMRRGEEAELTVFQSAFLGGQSRRVPGQRVRVIRSAWERLGHPPAESGRDEARDVDVLVGAVRAAAAAGELAGPVRPWLAGLPPVLPLSTVDSEATGSGVTLVYGRVDEPERRAQPAAGWDLTSGTNLLAAGRPRSGRTTLLRTLAAAAARYPTEQVQLYAMDSGGGLADLAGLPHCGAVVDQSELDRGARLLDRLERTVRERERAPGGRTPHLVLLIDDWEGWQQTFGEADNGALHDQLVRIARRGPAAGVHVAVTGASTLLSSGRSRALTEASQERLALPFDPADYAWLGVPATALPSHPRPGQAIRLGQPPRTVQVAVAGDELSGTGTGSGTGAGAGAVGGARPWRVDRLPDEIGVAAARALPRDPGGDAPTWVPLGVGGDELRQFGVDLREAGPGAFVTGERRSGRSTALLTIALDVVSRGGQVVVFAPVRTSAMHALSGVPGVAAILGVRQPTARQAQLALASAGTGPCVVLVDDAEHLLRGDANAVLREFLMDTDHAPAGVVVAAALEDLGGAAPGSFLAEAGRSGTGLLLGPRGSRVQLFGSIVRIPESYVAAERPGRAVLFRARQTAPVQVPLATPESATAAVVEPRRRVGPLLQLTDALAGPAPTTVERLRGIVADLLDAGFDGLSPSTLDKTMSLAGAGFDGTPADLLAEAGRPN